MSMLPPLGCVLAGGRSRRMGRDKATLVYQGVPLAGHMVRKLTEVGCNAVIAGSRPDLEQYAPSVEDLHPGCGPLSGIEAALHFAGQRAKPPGSPVFNSGFNSRSNDEQVLFVPVDLPLLPVSFLAMLLERAARTGALAALPMLGSRPQPLCAVYRCSLLPGISRALDAGDHKVIRVIESLTNDAERDFFRVEAASTSRDGWGESLETHRWFGNVNTPADLAMIEAFHPRPPPE